MSLLGVVREDAKGFLVEYTTTFMTEPTRQTCFWRVVEICRSPYAIGLEGLPKDGDQVRLSGDMWQSPMGSRYTRALPRERRSASPGSRTRAPRSGRTETRYQGGEWQKLTRKGWVTL